jgi:hypothetical protein
MRFKRWNRHFAKKIRFKMGIMSVKMGHAGKIRGTAGALLKTARPQKRRTAMAHLKVPLNPDCPLGGIG